MNPAQAPLQPIQTAQAVYGLQIQDNRLALVTKRVLTMAMISALFVILQQVCAYAFVSWIAGLTVSVDFVGIIGLALAFLVPACGYYGAKNSDRNLTGAFTLCNALGVILSCLFVYQACRFFSVWSSGSLHFTTEYTAFIVASLILRLISCVLQLFSAVFGKELYDALNNGSVIHVAAPSMPVVQPVVAQPAVTLAQPVAATQSSQV